MLHNDAPLTELGININYETSEKKISEYYYSSRRQEMQEIIKAYKNGQNILYFTNFIEINGKTYNGYDKRIVDNLLASV